MNFFFTGEEGPESFNAMKLQKKINIFLKTHGQPLKIRTVSAPSTILQPRCWASAGR
jgi:hypothetical protein